MDDLGRGLAVESMVSNPGWQVIKDWIVEQIDNGKENLMRVPVDKISSTRARVKAYQQLLNRVIEFIEEKDKLLKEEQEK